MAAESATLNNVNESSQVTGEEEKVSLHRAWHGCMHDHLQAIGNLAQRVRRHGALCNAAPRPAFH